MKTLSKLKPEPGIWIADRSVPTIGPNDVLIKIKTTSLCGTDIHIYNWDDWAQKTVPVPLIVGHEFAGEIVEVGSAVERYQVGDRVSGENHITCGYCRNCRAGHQHLCPHTVSVGVTRDGCFAEYLSLPAANAFLVHDAIADDVASILNPLGNSTHTALSFDLVGEDVLITGAGPVGIMAVAIARHVGARHVVITDVNDYRLSLAREMGATRAVNGSKQSLKDVMAELKMQEGFDVGLEMSGNAQAFKDMLEHMIFGGRIALLGFLPENTLIDWNQVIMKGLIIKGIYGREMFETWYKMSAMLQSGLNITPVLTHRLPYTEFQQAFDVMRSGQAGKVVLDWE